MIQAVLLVIFLLVVCAAPFLIEAFARWEERHPEDWT